MRRVLNRSLLMIAAVPASLLAQGPRSLPLKYDARPTTSAISAADLMSRLYRYADDSMMGRDGGSPFNAKATDYIAAEMRRLGLEPAGENGGYFQQALINRSLDSAGSSLSIDGRSFVMWTDFVPRDAGPTARPFDGMQAVYGGVVADTARMIPRGSAAGKIVVLTLPRDSNDRLNFDLVNRNALTNRFIDAAAIMVVATDILPPTYVRDNYMGTGLGVRGQRAPIELPSYAYVSFAAARAMFGGANPEGLALGTTGRTVRGVFRVNETFAPGRNVIGILRGSDPVLRNQYVAIGAHNDHVGFFPTGGRFFDADSVRIYNRIARRQGVEERGRALTAAEQVTFRAALDSAHRANGGMRNDSIFNGADDDGSGTVGLLEIAEQFAGERRRPRRSLIFISHVAEEYGMFGARYFTDHPTVPRDSIVAQLNIDMIGRGGTGDLAGVTSANAPIEAGPGYLQLIGSRRLSTELGDLVETVNTQGRFGMRFDYSLDANGHPQNIYCRSDHAMYARYGIPVVFFTTGGHSDYHQVSDEPQYIDYQKLERVTSLIHAVALRVANLDHRPVVNGPRPDPTANCQQ